MSEDATTLQTLYGVLIALENDALLLPNTALAEVAPRERLVEGTGHADWLGTLEWHGKPVPALSFEALNGQPLPAAGEGRVRFAVLHALSDDFRPHAWAVRCGGYPRMVPLNAAALEPLPLRASDHPDFVLARVRVGAREAIIPDLERIEAGIRAARVALG